MHFPSRTFAFLSTVAALALGSAHGTPGTPDLQRWTGSWVGPLQVQAFTLRIVFQVRAESDSTLGSTMDSPDQGAAGIPVAETLVSGDTIRFIVSGIGGRYEGIITRGDTLIQGSWSQGGMTLPLTLRKSSAPPAVRRPQEPTAPYPYDEEEVTFLNTSDSVWLAGTLTRPRGQGQFPGVVLISGSGPQDRNGSVFGHRPFLVMADFLTRKGIVVLRYDERGIGGSTGSFEAATMEEFARDAESALTYLGARADIDPDRIGLLGHSEGGIIVPTVAARSPQPAFLVLMAAPALPGEEILRLQSDRIARAMGATEEEAARICEQNVEIYALVKSEPDSARLASRIRPVLAEILRSRTGTDTTTLRAMVDQQIRMVTSPWFRHFLTFDPRPALRQVTCPVLALFAEKDLQVPPKENVAAAEGAFREGGNSFVTIRELAGLNHLFQESLTGSLSEYARIEQTIDPLVLDLIGDWILEQAPGTPQR